MRAFELKSNSTVAVARRALGPSTSQAASQWDGRVGRTHMVVVAFSWWIKVGAHVIGESYLSVADGCGYVACLIRLC